MSHAATATLDPLDLPNPSTMEPLPMITAEATPIAPEATSAANDAVATTCRRGRRSHRTASHAAESGMPSCRA
ncbi:hypothetical protein ABZS66_12155 [Dactylosporangium sp. NPDC005572]|uniref:hypothetical protein n=1 Tax=Dactylosporangium sp. NPDC005572 TaxID=3156889 RepID=UPI0033ABC8E4